MKTLGELKTHISNYNNDDLLTVECPQTGRSFRVKRMYQLGGGATIIEVEPDNAPSTDVEQAATRDELTKRLQRVKEEMMNLQDLVRNKL